MSLTDSMNERSNSKFTTKRETNGNLWKLAEMLIHEEEENNQIWSNNGGTGDAI